MADIPSRDPCAAQVYKGPSHPHDAQSPEAITFGGLTSEPDSKVLKLEDPDAVVSCA